MKIVKKRPLVILTTTVKLFFFGELQFKSLLKSRSGTETDVFVNIETNTYPMYQFHFWMLQVKLPVRCGGKKTLSKQSQSIIFVINTVNKLPFLWQNSLGNKTNIFNVFNVFIKNLISTGNNIEVFHLCNTRKREQDSRLICLRNLAFVIRL